MQRHFFPCFRTIQCHCEALGSEEPPTPSRRGPCSCSCPSSMGWAPRQHLTPRKAVTVRQSSHQRFCLPEPLKACVLEGPLLLLSQSGRAGFSPPGSSTWGLSILFPSVYSVGEIQGQQPSFAKGNIVNTSVFVGWTVSAWFNPAVVT